MQPLKPVSTLLFTSSCGSLSVILNALSLCYTPLNETFRMVGDSVHHHKQLPLQKRPAAETAAISRLWITDAFQLSDSYETFINAKSTEWYAMKVMSSRAEADVQALTSRQNSDGSWSWIDGEAGSPSATGLALLALGRAGALDSHSEVIDRARDWLFIRQLGNGSWKTFSTKRRNRSGRISNFWGTSWAVIGLLESLHQK